MEVIEQWYDIEGFNGFYQVSNKLRVKSVGRITTQKNGKSYTVKTRILSQCIDDVGYLCIKLRKDKKTITYRVHRIIAKTFIPNPNNKRCVNHINGIKTDNRVENLEWVTHSENAIHAIEKLGAQFGKSASDPEVRKKMSIGSKRAKDIKNGGNKCRHGHELTPENLRKRKDGVRACRICANEACRRCKAKKRLIKKLNTL